MAPPLTRLLLDTSAVITASLALTRSSGKIAAISVITLGELRAGVRLAADPSVRAMRQARLLAVRQSFAPLPIDEIIAEQYGELLALARLQKRTTKATDLLIVATAAATGRGLVTLDDAQAGLARAAGVRVER